MMRWSNGTVGRTASVIGVALAYGVVGCSAGTDNQPSNLGTGGVATAPGAGGTPTVTTNTGATTGVTPPNGSGATVGVTPPNGGGGVVTGAGGTPVVGGGGTPVIGGGGTPVVGGGGTTAMGGTTSMGGDTSGGGAAGDSSVGCGQGTFCQPADDLAPPAAADGFQIVSPSTITLTPGQEQFLCYYKNFPGGSTTTVGGFRSWMTKGASHHFIVFQSSGGGDGALTTCAFGSGAWIYATSKSGMLVGMDMPPQVGLPFNAGSQFELNMHLVNTNSDVVKPVIKLNVLFAKDVKYNAAAAYSALSPNLKINIPALGTQTVTGTCTVPAGSNFFLWTTHTHKFATNVDVNYVSGGQTTRIVNTTDWENPGTHVWTAPNFLTTKAGDSFNYACTYKNTTTLPVTFGETAASNEMCMAIGYFFPAGQFLCN